MLMNLNNRRRRRNVIGERIAKSRGMFITNRPRSGKVMAENSWNAKRP